MGGQVPSFWRFAAMFSVLLHAQTCHANEEVPVIHVESAEIHGGWCEIMLLCNVTRGANVSVRWVVTGKGHASSQQISANTSTLSVILPVRSPWSYVSCEAVGAANQEVASLNVGSMCDTLYSTHVIMAYTIAFLVANVLVLSANAILFIQREHWRFVDVAESAVRSAIRFFVTASSPVAA